MGYLEFGDEIILVFVPIGHPLHRSDPGVDPFERATGGRTSCQYRLWSTAARAACEFLSGSR